jgi:hypothetical protein
MLRGIYIQIAIIMFESHYDIKVEDHVTAEIK